MVCVLFGGLAESDGGLLQLRADTEVAIVKIAGGGRVQEQIRVVLVVLAMSDGILGLLEFHKVVDDLGAVVVPHDDTLEVGREKVFVVRADRQLGDTVLVAVFEVAD